MNRRAADQSGMTVIEVLITATLMVVVMGLVLTALESFGRSTTRGIERSEAVDAANLFVGQMARELRNATGWETGAATVSAPVILATGTDLVVKRVEPKVSPTAQNVFSTSTVRYCFNQQTRVLHRQVASGVATPAAACPDPSWSTPASVRGVANGAAPVFAFDAPALADIKSISIDLRIDDDPTRAPAAVRLRSGVALRNANRRPTAVLSAIPTPNRHLQLNASGSSDPESQTLAYAWSDNGIPIEQSGPVVDYIAPALGARTIRLVVTDPGGLSSETTQTVSVQP